MNYRNSQFPSRRETTAFGSASKNYSESARRQSSVSQLGRRQTNFGSCGATKQDPRPAKNSEFVRHCCARVETFVRGSCPKDDLSPKAFISPTSKDFAIIWDTVFHALDSRPVSFESPDSDFCSRWCKKMKDKKLEEQVASVFKGLGYSQTISKSALSAPGSTHSWPQIVMALEWLVGTIELKNKFAAEADAPLDLMETDEANDDLGKIFDWMTESYENFLNGKDDRVKELDGAYFSEISSSQERQKEENTTHRLKLEGVTNELLAMQQTSSPLVKMQNEIQMMQQDEATLNLKIEQLQDLLFQIDGKSKELKTKLESRRTEISTLDQEIFGLRDRVSKQSTTKEDITRLTNERDKLDQMLKNAMSLKAEVEQGLNNKEVQIDGLLNQIEKTAHAYNSEARKLKILPTGNKHSSGIDFGIKIDREASRLDEVCTADHKGTIRPGLERIAEMYVSKKASRDEEIKRATQNGHQLQEELDKLQLQRQQCVVEIQKVKEETRSCRESDSGVKTKLQEHMNSMDHYLAQLLQERQEMIRSIEQQLPEAQEVYRTTAKYTSRESLVWMGLTVAFRRCSEERARLNGEIERVTGSIRSVIQQVDGELDRLVQCVDAAQRSLDEPGGGVTE